MATIREEIIDDFLRKLSEDSDIDGALVEALRELLSSGKPLRIDDLVAKYGATKKESGA